MNAAPVYPTPEMMGNPRSGISQLRDMVAAYFVEHSVEAMVAEVGLKYRTFQLNQSNPSNANRVVFIPGEYDGGTAVKPRRYGSLDRASRNHASVVNPRELLNWERPITISVWSAPVPGAARDEGSTIAIAEDLLEQVVRAVHSSGMGDITWGSVTINAPPVENSFGVELLVSITQRGPLFDTTLDYAQPIASMPATSVEMT